MSRKILVKVSPTGGIEIEANGFQGKGCTDATRALEEALGFRTNRQTKPEFRLGRVTPIVRQALGEGGEEP
jgi:hypothetical protein